FRMVPAGIASRPRRRGRSRARDAGARRARPHGAAPSGRRTIARGARQAVSHPHDRGRDPARGPRGRGTAARDGLWPPGPVRVRRSHRGRLRRRAGPLADVDPDHRRRPRSPRAAAGGDGGGGRAPPGTVPTTTAPPLGPPGTGSAKAEATSRGAALLALEALGVLPDLA